MAKPIRFPIRIAQGEEHGPGGFLVRSMKNHGANRRECGEILANLESGTRVVDRLRFGDKVMIQGDNRSAREMLCRSLDHVNGAIPQEAFDLWHIMQCCPKSSDPNT